MVNRPRPLAAPGPGLDPADLCRKAQPGIGLSQRIRAVARLAAVALVSAAALLAAALFVAAVPATRAHAETIYVAPNGDATGPRPANLLPAGEGTLEAPLHDLKRAAARAELRSTSENPVRILLAPGHYWLDPEETVEPTCGNCVEPRTPVTVTVGLRLAGTRVVLQGPTDPTAEPPRPLEGRGFSGKAGPAILHTRSGYGILVQDCEDCIVEDLVLTDGMRDLDGNATDAAVVVQRSSAIVRRNVIRENIGDPQVVQKVVVGIMGVTGREQSRIRIEDNRILRNSWDGIALYRDAQATILGNVINGVDLATGGRVGGGRGVGIGLTWNAQATVRGNLVTRYWKGIGIFVDAQAHVEDNVVERVATWGLSLWDAEKGSPRGEFRGNVVDSTGACGAAVIRANELGDAGYLIENVFRRTAQNARYDHDEVYCFQAAIALHAKPEGFRVEQNLLLENREPDDAPGSGDRPVDEIAPALRVICAKLAQLPATRQSLFVREFGVEVLGLEPPAEASQPASVGSEGARSGWDNR